MKTVKHGEGWYASMLARVPIYHIGYYLLIVCVRGSYCTVSSGGIRHQLHPVYIPLLLHRRKKIILRGSSYLVLACFVDKYTSSVQVHKECVCYLLILTDLDFRFCFFMGYCHNWWWFSTFVLRIEKLYRKTRENI